MSHYHYDLSHHNLPGSAHGPLVDVEGLVVQSFDDEAHRDGKHQEFRLHVTKTNSIEGGNDSLNGQTIFVAVRFGDSDAKHDRIDGIEVGQTVHVKGEYVPSTMVKASENNSGPVLPVIHFAYRPVGFVELNGARYQ